MSITKYSVVIIEHGADYFLVRCGHCGGDGKYYGTCSVCNGAGKVLLRVPASLYGADVGLVKCGLCGGDGKYYGVCSVCKGVGVVVGQFPRVVCGTCGGDGKHYGVCAVCGGVGSLHVGTLSAY